MTFSHQDQKTIEPETQLESFDPLTIPFEIIQTTFSAKNNDNESMEQTQTQSLS
jgi:hypothetical protein